LLIEEPLGKRRKEHILVGSLIHDPSESFPDIGDEDG
jgi:hypothetical protein